MDERRLRSRSASRPVLAWAVIGLWALVALVGGLWLVEANLVDLDLILVGPGPSGWLGYDDLGRPLLARILVGARYSFLVALGVVAISAVVGTAIGIVAAYAGGWVDLVLIRIIDVFLAFPGILLAIALAGVMGPGLDNVIIALSIVGWVGFARLARVQALSLKPRDHVAAAIALGVDPWRIMVRHLLPLLAAPIIVEATFAIAGVVIAEAGLSFLGLGIQPPTPSWGSMIRDGTRYMLVAPHMVLAPGLSLMAVVLAVNVLGDRLADRLDVRRR